MTDYRHECIDCGKPCYGERCQECAAKWRKTAEYSKRHTAIVRRHIKDRQATKNNAA